MSQSPEVLHILQPLPRSSGAPKLTEDSWQERPGPYSGKGRKKGKGKGKGKALGKSVRVPPGLAGTRSHTNAGKAICFGYGLKTCRETCVKNRCPCGLHICGGKRILLWTAPSGRSFRKGPKRPDSCRALPCLQRISLPQRQVHARARILARPHQLSLLWHILPLRKWMPEFCQTQSTLGTEIPVRLAWSYAFSFEQSSGASSSSQMPSHTGVSGGGEPPMFSSDVSDSQSSSQTGVCDGFQPSSGTVGLLRS